MTKQIRDYVVEARLIREQKQKLKEAAEKEFTIKLVTPFGKAKVCSWKANSVDAAVKEFLDANPAYRENKKGAVIAESSQKNEALNLDSLTDTDAKQLIQYLQDFIKDKSSKYYYIDKIEAILKKKYKAESISDDIVREVKEEVKDGVKDFVQQDVDAKLNGEVTPADYQATYGEDIDDDSDSIFGDELDNAESDEPEQTNESIDEASLKDFLKSEHSMALKKIKNMAADDPSSFYKGYATAIHNVQRKFGL